MKYRLRLGEIEAICWDSEENAEKIKKMLGDNLIVKTSDSFGVNFFLKTQFGEDIIRSGDYVFKDIYNYLHICGTSEFKEQFVPVEYEKSEKGININGVIWDTILAFLMGKNILHGTKL